MNIRLHEVKWILTHKDYNVLALFEYLWFRGVKDRHINWNCDDHMFIYVKGCFTCEWVRDIEGMFKHLQKNEARFYSRDIHRAEMALERFARTADLTLPGPMPTTLLASQDLESAISQLT